MPNKCRRSYCANTYNNVVGEGMPLKGAECIPCLYAMQMVSRGHTPDQVEAVPHLFDIFHAVLERGGWTWEHVKESYSRIQSLPKDVQEIELLN
jgi:hypothetical protein